MNGTYRAIPLERSCLCFACVGSSNLSGTDPFFCVLDDLPQRISPRAEKNEPLERYRPTAGLVPFGMLETNSPIP